MVVDESYLELVPLGVVEWHWRGEECVGCERGADVDC